MSVYFYAFTIKTDFKNMSENRRFTRKNRAKPSQSSDFDPPPFFFPKKPLYLLKIEKNPNRSFIVKISAPKNFMSFR